MRIEVRKFLFVGSMKHRKSFFSAAQRLGKIDFIKGSEVFSEKPLCLERLEEALKILQPHVDEMVQQHRRQDEDRYLAETIAQHVIELQKTLDEEKNRLQKLKIEMERVRPFGSFSMADIQDLERSSKRVVQFYAASKGAEAPASAIQVAADEQAVYYVALHAVPQQYEHLHEIAIDRDLGVLQREQQETEQRLGDLHQAIRAYAPFSFFLKQNRIRLLDQFHLAAAEDKTQNLLKERLFSIEGWVPADHAEAARQLADQTATFCEEIAVGSKDVVPTHLVNEGLPRIGEDLVHIYDTPSVRDKDPSLWVLAFFALFFGFIVNDAGYGLIFLIMALWGAWKLPYLRHDGKRFLHLGFILAGSCIVWGVLATSFFGLEIPLDSVWRKFSLTTWLVQKKAAWLGVSGDLSWELFHDLADQILMELALTIGLIHIALGLGRYLYRSWSGLGWILFLMGAYWYTPSYLETASLLHYVFHVPMAISNGGLYLLGGGFMLAVALALIQHGWHGLEEGAVVIKLFADVMSYLRLYALAMAGAMLIETFNGFAAQLPFVLAALLLVVANALNLGLAIMGGVIHGLRLNFLEWYHYSFEGGGKRFHPLTTLYKEQRNEC